MLGGVEYLINVMDVHRDKLLYYLVIHCWIVLLYFLISLVFSFIITLLINLLPKFVLWTIVVLCLIVLTTECVNSFVKYKELSTNQGEVFLPTFIINTYSYWWNKNTWLVCSIILGSITVFILLLLLASSFSKTPIKATINNIEEASRVAGWKILILIPILQSIRQGSSCSCWYLWLLILLLQAIKYTKWWMPAPLKLVSMKLLTRRLEIVSPVFQGSFLTILLDAQYTCAHITSSKLPGGSSCYQCAV